MLPVAKGKKRNWEKDLYKRKQVKRMERERWVEWRRYFIVRIEIGDYEPISLVGNQRSEITTSPRNGLSSFGCRKKGKAWYNGRKRRKREWWWVDGGWGENFGQLDRRFYPIFHHIGPQVANTVSTMCTARSLAVSYRPRCHHRWLCTWNLYIAISYKTRDNG